MSGTIFIDPDCLACAACGKPIGRGPYALTASNAVVHAAACEWCVSDVAQCERDGCACECHLSTGALP